VSPVNRRARSDATRTRIIGSAYELFRQNGYRPIQIEI